MADSKVSELTAATAAAGADSLYLVQSSTSKSITVANLFATVSTPVQFTNTVQVGDRRQRQDGAGACGSRSADLRHGHRPRA